MVFFTDSRCAGGVARLREKSFMVATLDKGGIASDTQSALDKIEFIGAVLSKPLRLVDTRQRYNLEFI